MLVVQKSSTGVKNHTYDKIGFMYLEHLCTQNKFEEAAQKSVKILGEDQKAWEYHFYKFQEHGKVKVRF